MMKPDSEYTRKLLIAFEEALDPTTDIYELRERGLDYESKEFMFHLRLLEDDGFVEREDGEPGFGLVRSVDGMYSWSVLPLRLTSSGHEFAVAMRSEHGFQAVKKSAIIPGLKFMRDVAVGALKAELIKHGFPS
jgi:hypothetical protein